MRAGRAQRGSRRPACYLDDMKTLPLLRSSLGLGVLLPEGRTLPISMILGIGKNYAEHAKEMQKAEAQIGVKPTQPAAGAGLPTVFTKNLASLALTGDDIVIPPVCRDAKHGGPAQVDYEGELGFIIGPSAGGGPCRDVREADALSHVLGYCCANDVSARWWQKQGSGGQFFRGKSFDTFCPIGPGVIPGKAIADPARLRIVTRVNNEVRQDCSTGEMLLGVAALICELSRGLTLLPGTLILTGTPSGVGMGRTPPLYLEDGDVVEVEIGGIGTLSNRVRFAPAQADRAC